jgi:hypothetical protein
MSRKSIEIACAAAGSLLCIGVAIVHVDDQGGISAFTDPDWLGWAYRVLEVSALLVAVALLTGRLRVFAWISAALVAAGPLVGYLLSRTTGLPQERDDIGNWSDPVGIASLAIEGLLMVLAGYVVARQVSRSSPARSMHYSRDSRALPAA